MPRSGIAHPRGAGVSRAHNATRAAGLEHRLVTTCFSYTTVWVIVEV
jgi:hypothetical protein